MRFSRITVLCALCLLVAVPLSLRAQDNGPASAVSKEMAKQVTSVGEKWVKLLDAIPDDKLDWRPAKDVRSVRELFTHMGDANYFFLTFVGAKMPDSPALPKDQNERENRFTSKADILKNLKASFEFSKDQLSQLSDAAYAKEVKMFGNTTSARDAMVTNLGHMHEHLGQAIAYARVNDIIPPWSRGD